MWLGRAAGVTGSLVHPELSVLRGEDCGASVTMVPGGVQHEPGAGASSGDPGLPAEAHPPRPACRI